MGPHWHKAPHRPPEDHRGFSTTASPTAPEHWATWGDVTRAGEVQGGKACNGLATYSIPALKDLTSMPENTRAGPNNTASLSRHLHAAIFSANHRPAAGLAVPHTYTHTHTYSHTLRTPTPPHTPRTTPPTHTPKTPSSPIHTHTQDNPFPPTHTQDTPPPTHTHIQDTHTHSGHPSQHTHTPRTPSTRPRSVC